MDLTSLLETALTTQGYEVENAPPLEGRSGATYPASLLAHRDGRTHLVDATFEPVTENDLDALDAIVTDTGIDAAILFALSDETIEDAPATVEAWPRPQFETALGRHLLSDALDEDPDPIGPTPLEEAPEPQPQPEAQPPPQTRPEPEPDLAKKSQPQQQPPDTSKTSTPDSQPQDPTPAAAPSQAPDPEPQRQPDATPDPASAQGKDQDRFVSPEEMAKRAQQMLEQGEIPDDGDAELLTDEEASPQQGHPQEQRNQAQKPSTPQTQEQSAPPNQPEQPPAEETTPPDPTSQSSQQPEEGQVFEDADCELLPSTPPEDQQQETEGRESKQGSPTGQPPSSKEGQDRSATEAHRGSTSGPEPSQQSPLAATAPATGPEQDSFLSGGCLAPTVTEDQARNEAQGALFNVQEARLELLPFHVYDYACKLEGDGTTRSEDGRLWVSAQNGAIVEDPDGDLIDDPGIPHERYEPQLAAQNAAQEAKNHLIDALERREELREDYSETAVIERVTLTPNEQTLQLNHKGTAYAPRWRLEGQNGTVFVDALTGELVPA